MGVDVFFSVVLPDLKRLGNRVRLSRFYGCSFGVDVQSWLYKIINARKGTILRLSTTPRYPPEDLFDEFERRHNILLALGLRVVYVFDGKRHNGKHVARTKRNAALEEARAVVARYKARALQEPLTKADQEDVFKRGLKPLVVPDEEIISFLIEKMKTIFGERFRFMCAPFEAEKQLIVLQQDGIIEYILCIDSDLIVAGGDNLIYDISFPKTVDDGFGYLFRRINHPNLGKIDLKIASALKGCDYCHGLKRVGWPTILNTIMPTLVSKDNPRERMKYIASLSTQYEYKGEDFLKDFKQTIALFTYMPVLRVATNDPERLELVPLKPFRHSVSDNAWGSLMGFGGGPAVLLNVTPENYKRASLFDGCSFLTAEGNALRSFPVPVYSIQDHPSVEPETPLPVFARLEFDTIPMDLYPIEVIVAYAGARGIDVNSMETRNEIVQAIEALQPDALIVPPDEVIVQIERWDVDEVLEPLGDEWWRRDYYNVIPQLAQINDHDLDFFCRHGNEHIRERASLLAKSGSFMLSDTMETQQFQDSDGKRKLVVKCRCLPSMRTEVQSANVADERARVGYVVFLCFEHAVCMERVYWRPMGKNYSCCGCPDGQNMCSHLLGLMMVCVHMQFRARRGMSKERFEALFPVPANLTQTIATRIENIVRQDVGNRSVAQTRRREREHNMRDVANDATEEVEQP